MTIDSFLFFAAAGLSLLGAIAHEWLGAPKVLEPLKDADLPDSVVWLHHFSWHVGTVAVLAMVGMFAVAASTPENLLLAWIATLMSSGFAALGLSLAMFGNPALWRTPAPYPWALIAALGGLGLFFAGAS